MTHTEVLNLLLANACPSEVLGNGNYVFQIDLHCMTFEVVATLVSTMNTIQYEVVGIKSL